MNWSKVIERLEREAAALEREAQENQCDPHYWKNMTVASVAATIAEALKAGMGLGTQADHAVRARRTGKIQRRLRSDRGAWRTGGLG
jgi:hypothetical protein